MTNDTTTLPPIRTEPGPAYWYWSDSDDGERPLLGPSKTKVEAVDDWLAECGDDLRRELEPEGELPLPITDGTLRQMCPHVAQYRRPSISAEIFDADQLLEQMEDLNRTAIWPDYPIDLKPAMKSALERHMAAALFAFFEANGLWGEFRGLEWVGDREDD